MRLFKGVCHFSSVFDSKTLSLYMLRRVHTHCIIGFFSLAALSISAESGFIGVMALAASSAGSGDERRDLAQCYHLCIRGEVFAHTHIQAPARTPREPKGAM
jgi:hypothetical protein